MFYPPFKSFPFLVWIALSILMDICASLIAKDVSGGFSPVFLSGFSMLFLGLLFLPFGRFRASHLKSLFFLGVLLAFTKTLIFISYLFFSAGLIEIIYDLPFSFLLAPFFFHEKLRRHEIIGVSVAFFGMLILSYPFNVQTISLILIPLVASFLAGIYTNLIKKFKIDLPELIGGQFLIAGLLVLIFAFSFYSSSFSLPLVSHYLPEILLLASATGLGKLVLFRLIKKHPIHKVSIFFLAIAPGVILGEYLLFGTHLSLTELIGAVFVFFGLLFSQIHPKSLVAPRLTEERVPLR